MKKSDGSILAASLNIQTFISVHEGLLIGAFISVDDIVKAHNFHCSFKDAYIILADEHGYLTSASSNFIDRYLKGSSVALEESKCNISDIFEGVESGDKGE